MKSYTVAEWCEMHNLSRSMFYKLAHQGNAPKTFKVGTATRISEDANNAWVAELEAKAAA